MNLMALDPGDTAMKKLFKIRKNNTLTDSIENRTVTLLFIYGLGPPEDFDSLINIGIKIVYISNPALRRISIVSST